MENCPNEPLRENSSGSSAGFFLWRKSGPHAEDIIRSSRLKTAQVFDFLSDDVFSYLDCVLQFGILVVEHTETQWFFWNDFHQHQVATLQSTNGTSRKKYCLWARCV